MSVERNKTIALRAMEELDRRKTIVSAHGDSTHHSQRRYKMLANARISVVLPVVDLERAIHFYQEKLGLQAEEREDGAWFECGYGTQLNLYKRATPTTADHTTASWEVDNIEEAVRALRDRGVAFEQYDLPGLKTDAQGIAVIGTTKGAWFKDPEGNILALVEFE